MPPLRYTLRHNAKTFDWELSDSCGTAASSRHATHSSAFARLAVDPRLELRGATVRVFGADGGFECERTVAMRSVPRAVEAGRESKLSRWRGCGR